MQPWLLPAQPTPAHVGAAPCVPVSTPDKRSCCQGSGVWGLQAGTRPAQGRVKPLLALPPHPQHPFFHEHSHSLCALQVGPGSSRAGMDPKGLLRDWVGSVPPHTLPGWADKPSFYSPLSCFLFVKWLKTTPLLLQVPWPQCPTLARSRKEGRQILFSSLLSPKSPRSQCQAAPAFLPQPPDGEEAPARDVMPLALLPGRFFSCPSQKAQRTEVAVPVPPARVTGQREHWHSLQTQLWVHPTTGGFGVGIWHFLFCLFCFLKTGKHIVAKQ